jgi:hypothetical protein
MTAPFQCVKSTEKALASRAVPHMGARSVAIGALDAFNERRSGDLYGTANESPVRLLIVPDFMRQQQEVWLETFLANFSGPRNVNPQRVKTRSARQPIRSQPSGAIVRL